MARSVLHSPLSTGASRLSRGLAIAVIAHALMVAALVHWLHRDDKHEVELVNIEMAPPPPVAEALPEEIARQAEQAEQEQAALAAATAKDDLATLPNEKGEGVVDAGVVDAGVDAAPKPDARVKPDAVPLDAMPLEVAIADAGVVAADAGDPTQIAAGSGAGAGSGSGAGSDVALGSGNGSSLGTGSGSGSGVAAATETGSGSGVSGMDSQLAVDGAPTSAGTAANLLAYFPPGHSLGVLIRFDRLRGSEWATAAEELFRPMPDYQGLFGTKSADLATKLDMLVISTPRPRDATATTLVMKSTLGRSGIRDLLASSSTPVAWSVTKGGALGKRSGKMFAGDKRVVLSPWQSWYVLAQPEDLGGLTAASPGNLDTVETKAKLPPWLATIRTIAKESGDDQKKGPALVMTIGTPPTGTGPAKTGRYKLPELGLGVSSLPVPQRVSLAMELVTQGWLVRGNIVFGSAAEAAEMVMTLTDLQTRITDSHLLSSILHKQHVLNLVAGLSLRRAGGRVSYATSISISDARAVLNAAAQQLGGYFAQP